MNRVNQNTAVKSPPVKVNHKADNFGIWVLMDSAHFTISRSRFLEIAQFGLTPEKAQILHTIVSSGGSLTQNKISEFTMRQHHSVSSLINRMVKEGLLKKVKYPGDRTFTVIMTKKGQGKYKNLTHKSIDMILSSLTDKEKQTLYSLLEKLLSTSRSLLGMDYEPPFLKSDSEE
jgi:DNA-binding MarR family transcriptional regulator